MRPEEAKAVDVARRVVVYRARGMDAVSIRRDLEIPGAPAAR